MTTTELPDLDIVKALGVDLDDHGHAEPDDDRPQR